MKIILGTIALLSVSECVLAGIVTDPTVIGTNILDNIMGGSNSTVPSPSAASASVVSGTLDTGVPDLTDNVGTSLQTAAQRQLNKLCASKCKTEMCYLSDNNDCRNFITCQQDARGSYHATLQPCAFGAIWAGLQQQKKITCDTPENVVCNIDYCAGLPANATFDHKDGNCKTYWQCDINGKYTPHCCDDGYRYDNTLNRCVRDLFGTCIDKCPIKKDACLVPGTKTEFFDDGNCVTYWNCEDLHPHPVCCPDGQGYDVVRGGCIDKPLCRDICPEQYKPDVCLQPGVEKYSLIDGSCRTYMKCNALEGDERWCCPSGYLFDSNIQSCIEKTVDMNVTCADTCPQHYFEVCTLKPAYNRTDAYLVDHHGVAIEMPCAIGTEFDVSKCGCARPVQNAPDNSCRKELDIMFDAPLWHRRGSEKEVKIVNVGTIEEGPKLNGRTSFKFNGDLVFRTPYFQSQYDKLYIKLVYLPETGPIVGNLKQILLSNCMNLDLGAATMELALQNDRLVLQLVTDSLLHNATSLWNRPVMTSVPYTPGIWNTLTVIYDGNDVYMLNEGSGLPTFDKKALTGPISVAAEGLDFGGCYVNQKLTEGYRGSLAELQFSKCLHQTWVDRFNDKLPALP